MVMYPDHLVVGRGHTIYLATEDCIRWPMMTLASGYGIKRDARYPQVTVTAHRWVYEQLHGLVDKGLQIDHLCHNADLTCLGGSTCPHRACVNPRHLEPVTPTVNARRKEAHWRAARTVPLPEGWTGDLTRYDADGNATHCWVGHDLAVVGVVSPARPRCGECTRLSYRIRYHASGGAVRDHKREYMRAWRQRRRLAEALTRDEDRVPGGADQLGT